MVEDRVGAFRSVWRCAVGSAPAGSDQYHRYLAIVRGASSTLVAKGTGILVGLLLVPLAVRHLGPEQYGVWMTIFSVVAWMCLADLGLGSSLTNALCESYGKRRQDIAQQYVATVFWVLAGLGLLIAGAFVIAWTQVDWVRALGVSATSQSDPSAAVLAAVLIYLLALPFTLVPNIYFAYQEGGRANYWSIVGTVGSFAAAVAAIWVGAGLLGLVIASSGTTALVMLVSAGWLFTRRKPWLSPSMSHIRRDALGRVGRLGGLFFLLQAAAMGLYWSGPLIIANHLGAAMVTPYNVAWRLFSLTMLAQVLLRPSLWPAYAEAFARDDAPWIRRTFRLHAAVNLAITGGLAMVLVFLGQHIIEVWAGKDAVPPQRLLVWMAAWAVVMVFGETLATLLGSSGRIRWQAAYGVASAAVSIALSLWWVERYGVVGVVAAMLVAFVTCCLIPASVETMLVLREPAKYYVPVTRTAS